MSVVSDYCGFPDSIYTGLYDGRLVHIKNGKIIEEVRFTKAERCGSIDSEPICGRPLGIRRLNEHEMVVADAYFGVFVVNLSKVVFVLKSGLNLGTFRHVVKSNTPIEGRFMRFLNDIEVEAYGRKLWNRGPHWRFSRFGFQVLNEDEIIFTDSSSKWDRRHLFNIFLESEPNGRIFKHKISTGKTEVLADKLYFPNGIQLHPDGKSALFAECSKAMISRLNLQTNEVTPFATNLPGFPDNIRRGANGTLWVGMAGVRHIDAPSLIDALGAYTLLRQILLDIVPSHWWIKYLHMVRPAHAVIVQLDAQGEITQSLHDTKGTHIQDVSQVSHPIHQMMHGAGPSFVYYVNSLLLHRRYGVQAEDHFCLFSSNFYHRQAAPQCT
uniref:Str_synth domain-containing protein n=1 Tax=Angiostrongylus cantonensis TaxID=6313 RepID=A0A158P6G7_ANGCA